MIMLASKGFNGHPTYVGDGVLHVGLGRWMALHHAGSDEKRKFIRDTPTNRLVVEGHKMERIGFSIIDGDRKDSYVLASVDVNSFLVWPVSGSRCLSAHDESRLLWCVSTALWGAGLRSVAHVFVHSIREVVSRQ